MEHRTLKDTAHAIVGNSEGVHHLGSAGHRAIHGMHEIPNHHCKNCGEWHEYSHDYHKCPHCGYRC